MWEGEVRLFFHIVFNRLNLTRTSQIKSAITMRIKILAWYHPIQVYTVIAHRVHCTYRITENLIHWKDILLNVAPDQLTYQASGRLVYRTLKNWVTDEGVHPIQTWTVPINRSRNALHELRMQMAVTIVILRRMSTKKHFTSLWIEDHQVSDIW